MSTEQTEANLLDLVSLGDLFDSCEPSVDIPGNGSLQPPLLVLQLSFQLFSLPVQHGTQAISASSSSTCRFTARHKKTATNCTAAHPTWIVLWKFDDSESLMRVKAN